MLFPLCILCKLQPVRHPQANKGSLHSATESLRDSYIYTSEDGGTGPCRGGGTTGPVAASLKTRGSRNYITPMNRRPRHQGSQASCIARSHYGAHDWWVQEPQRCLWPSPLNFPWPSQQWGLHPRSQLPWLQRWCSGSEIPGTVPAPKTRSFRSHASAQDPAPTTPPVVPLTPANEAARAASKTPKTLAAVAVSAGDLRFQEPHWCRDQRLQEPEQCTWPSIPPPHGSAVGVGDSRPPGSFSDTCESSVPGSGGANISRKPRNNSTGGAHGSSTGSTEAMESLATVTAESMVTPSYSSVHNYGPPAIAEAPADPKTQTWQQCPWP